MAGKIPVLETIGKTYEFAFRRYFAVLGIVWLPMVALMAIAYLLLPTFLAIMSDAVKHIGQKGYQPDMTAFQARIWIFNLISYVIVAIIMVGISKEVLGLRKGPRFVYLAFGAAELRVLGAFLLLLAMFYGVLIVGALGGLALFGIGAGIVAAIGPANLHVSANTLAGGGAILIGIALSIAFVYVLIRLSYLIVPVTVAERRLGIFRSWELTKDNVWRIIGIGIATILPILVVLMILEIAAFAPVVMEIVSRAQKHQQPMVDFSAFARTYLRYLPFYALIGFLFSPIWHALLLTSPNFAYRTLVPDEEKPTSS